MKLPAVRRMAPPRSPAATAAARPAPTSSPARVIRAARSRRPPGKYTAELRGRCEGTASARPLAHDPRRESGEPGVTAQALRGVVTPREGQAAPGQRDADISQRDLLGAEAVLVVLVADAEVETAHALCMQGRHGAL